MFSPDINGDSGTFLYQNDSDGYTVFDICAKVLIDVEKKTLYIYNCIMDYQDLSFNGRQDDIIFKNGGIKAFKKRGDYVDAINSLTKNFFGDTWRCYARYTKKNINKEQKKNLKILKNVKDVKELKDLSYLPNDILEIISKNMAKWTNIIKVTPDDMKYYLEIKNINIGASANDWGKYYAWDTIISVYNPLQPPVSNL
jgi:hypothetical protein